MPVSSAPADVAVEGILHLGRRQISSPFGVDEALHAHHHPGAAEPALSAVVVGQPMGVGWHNSIDMIEFRPSLGQIKEYMYRVAHLVAESILLT